MGIKILDINYEADYIPDDDFEDENIRSSSKKMGLDARRRLENRKEELRLQRELRDYDWDN